MSSGRGFSDSFKSALAAKLSMSLEALQRSQAAAALREFDWYQANAEAAVLPLIEDYVAQAKKLEIPLEAACMRRVDSRYYWGDKTNMPDLVSLSKDYKTGGAVKALADAGFGTWIVFSPQEKASKSSAFSSASPSGASIYPIESMAKLIFPSEAERRYQAVRLKSSRKLLLLASFRGMEHLDPGFPGAWAKVLGAAYMEAVGRVEAGSLGVKGAADKASKDDAKLLLDGWEHLKKMGLEKTFPIEESILSDAKLRFESKAKEQEGFDPKKLKASLDESQKMRLATLCQLAQGCGGDSEAMEVLLAASPWIKDNPQALCVGVGRKRSFASEVMSNARVEALQELLRLGSNLWLASSQDGEPNAVAWAVKHLEGGWRPSEEEKARLSAMRDSVAKLLAYGAFVDGASDPVGHSLKKCDEARQLLMDGYDDSERLDILTQLRSKIESLAIKDVIGEQEALQNDAMVVVRRKRL